VNEPPFIAIDPITRAQFLKFSGIGVIAFLIDVVVFQAVLSLSSASLYAARVVSFVVATSVAWWMNRTFTFRDAENARPDLQWARFFAANLVGGTVSYAIFVLMIAIVPLAAAYPVLALAAGSVSGVAFNFTAYLRYVFRTDTGSSRLF
jgi:putative flippase GtrA